MPVWYAYYCMIVRCRLQVVIYGNIITLRTYRTQSLKEKESGNWKYRTSTRRITFYNIRYRYRTYRYKLKKFCYDIWRKPYGTLIPDLIWHDPMQPTEFFYIIMIFDMIWFKIFFFRWLFVTHVIMTNLPNRMWYKIHKLLIRYQKFH